MAFNFGYDSGGNPQWLLFSGDLKRGDAAAIREGDLCQWENPDPGEARILVISAR